MSRLQRGRQGWARAAAAKKPQNSPEIISGCCHYLQKQHPHSLATWQQAQTLLPNNDHHNPHIQPWPTSPSSASALRSQSISSNRTATDPCYPNHSCPPLSLSQPPVPPPQIHLQWLVTLNLGPVRNWYTCSSLLASVHAALLSF